MVNGAVSAHWSVKIDEHIKCSHQEHWVKPCINNMILLLFN